MTDTFDAEKVETFWGVDVSYTDDRPKELQRNGKWATSEDNPEDNGTLDFGNVVRRCDYDKLLEMYRKLVPAVPCYVCGEEAKGSPARTVDTKGPVCMKCWQSA